MASQHKNKLDKRFGRSAPFRSIPDRVLIVMEGTKTEPSYFKNLVSELELRTVKICPSADSAPISVVNEAKKRVSKDKDFEQIYCVFD